jgi:hypothetical protein
LLLLLFRDKIRSRYRKSPQAQRCQQLRTIYNLAGAGSRIRTDDLLITNQLLYQLSYAGKNAAHINAHRRLEQVAQGYKRERVVTESGSAVSRFLITVLR